MSVVSDRLTELLAHRRTGDAENDAILDGWILALSDAMDRLGLVAFGDPDADPPIEGKSVLRDPRYAPIWALAHAALYTGATLPGRGAAETEESWLARARDAAVYPLGIKRGSEEALRRVISPLLTGSKSIFIVENVGGNPYVIQVRTIEGETADPTAVQAAIEGDYVSSGRRGAMRAEQQLVYIVSDDPTFADATLAFDDVPDGVTAENVTREDVT